MRLRWGPLSPIVSFFVDPNIRKRSGIFTLKNGKVGVESDNSGNKGSSSYRGEITDEMKAMGCSMDNVKEFETLPPSVKTSLLALDTTFNYDSNNKSNDNKNINCLSNDEMDEDSLTGGEEDNISGKDNISAKSEVGKPSEEQKGENENDDDNEIKGDKNNNSDDLGSCQDQVRT